MHRSLSPLVALLALLMALSLVVACSAPSTPAPSSSQPAGATKPASVTAAPAASAATSPAQAAAPTKAAAPAGFPSKPVEIIVPAAAGGGQDLYTRVVTKYAEKFFGKSIFITNTPGTTGYTKIANAKPDGYTLGSAPPTAVLQPMLMKDLAYTPKSFKWIIQHSFDPVIVTVKKGSPLDLSPEKLLEYAKAHPKQIKVGLPALYSQQDLATVALGLAVGTEFDRVHFESGSQALTALLGDHVDMSMNYYSEIMSQLQAGGISAVATMNDGKWELLPDVPSFKEKGYDVVFGNWRAITGPKELPDNLVQPLHDAFKQALDLPEMKEDLKKAGFPVLYRNAADTQKYVESEIDGRYAKLIKDLNITSK